MDPLIEVSTDGGRNMRKTCARVLAAALMTGAIATVVGMAAHLGTPSEPDRLPPAPPSSLQRTVRLAAQPAPASRHQAPAARPVTVRTIHVQPRSRAITPDLVVVRRQRSKRPTTSRELAVTATTPTPTADVPAAQPAPVAVPTPEEQNDGHDHGRGHAYGRAKQDD
jgi:hypothetical protein